MMTFLISKLVDWKGFCDLVMYSLEGFYEGCVVFWPSSLTPFPFPIPSSKFYIETFLKNLGFPSWTLSGP